MPIVFGSRPKSAVQHYASSTFPNFGTVLVPVEAVCALLLSHELTQQVPQRSEWLRGRSD